MNTNKTLKYWTPIIIAMVFVLGLLLGYWLNRGPKLTPGQQKLNELLGIISENYVDSVDMDSVIERSLPALLSSLDPHSVYIPRDEVELANTELEGSFGGIGIQFQVFNDTVSIVEVIDHGPSQKVGVMPGDRIIAVDGKPFKVSEIGGEDKIFSYLRGKKGTTVQLTVLRHGEKKPLTFTITRGDIPMPSIEAAFMSDDRTGYVKVTKFARNTYREFLNAMTRLHYDGARDFIIDLRGNTGGFMEPAILMANEFLGQGDVIVATRGRDPELNEIVMSDGTGAFQNARLVVLIDEYSASASEIFSGAVQDNDRGLIVGRRSFGKGLVQQQLTLDDGSQIRLTIQRYYTPAGRCIQKEYHSGDNDSYESEIYERYLGGEFMNEDSIKVNKDLMFKTRGGRTVYGGGGIMPDVFVPNDTTGITNYYMQVAQSGLLQKFAYEYVDLNRQSLSKAKDVKSLLRLIPSDNILLNSFVDYAARRGGIKKRWYYINQSGPLIVTQLKAFIARNMLGVPAYYEVMNTLDKNVERALKGLAEGQADFPVRPIAKQPAKNK